MLINHNSPTSVSYPLFPIGLTTTPLLSDRTHCIEQGLETVDLLGSIAESCLKPRIDSAPSIKPRLSAKTGLSNTFPKKSIEIPHQHLSQFEVQITSTSIELPVDTQQRGIPDTTMPLEEAVDQTKTSNWKFVVVESTNGEWVMRAGDKNAHPSEWTVKNGEKKRSKALHHPSLAGFNGTGYLDHGDRFPVLVAGTIQRDDDNSIQFVIDSGNYSVGKEGDSATNRLHEQNLIQFFCFYMGLKEEEAQQFISIDS